MSRVLWLGDAGCTTGFATVTHAIGDRLVEQHGHDVSVLATNFTGDHWPTPMKLYVPKAKGSPDAYGMNRFLEMLSVVSPDVVISLNDPLVILRHLFKNQFDRNVMLARYAPILAYMPVDGQNYPPTIGRIADLVKALEPLDGANTKQPMLLPVVMSKFGTTLYPDAPIVPHGIDSDYWVPASVRPINMPDGSVLKSKTDARKALGLPTDAILAVRVDRNSLRKNYADTILAMEPVMRKEPKLHLWLHCSAEDGAGVDLNLFVQRFPGIQDRIHWPGSLSTVVGWSTEALRAVYTAGDFFVSTSGGEGFGLTLGEALSMGLPVIAMNVSAIPEVVGPGGILLEPERTYVPLSGQDNWLPNVTAFTSAITDLVQSRGKRRTLGEAGRKHVVDSFSWDEAAVRFDQLISAVQKASGVTAVGGP